MPDSGLAPASKFVGLCRTVDRPIGPMSHMMQADYKKSARFNDIERIGIRSDYGIASAIESV